ncbi:zinc-dependent alcohol dehydrogenase [Nocardioides acrostichi]|uniref:Alcohol dehydrogenase catalytic domain-containing protein n=1 Tax=Nocardioides acrostichi TaxID=2784339 RepID=A0A930UZV6_9ACTN|nr:alcohol dehydrogenase catalytic domain-containing protein [Nocardioides acrostichi]MBF4163106.1 alcohol dehydrogenase catalytic domain-containing protein [Nocardioides acrostichi]
MSGAAVVQALLGPGRLEERSLDLPEVGSDDGLLEVLACGLCGSDVASFTGGKQHEYPVVLGHEVVGRVAEAGEQALRRWGVSVGDRVVLEEALPCLGCDLCRSGRQRLCTRLGLRLGDTGIGTAPSLWGGYASHLYLHPHAQLHRVPDAVPDDVATLFIPLSNGLSWMRDRAELRPGQSVVVIGSGQHGVATALAARHLGASSATIVGTAADAGRLDLAARLGARTVAIDPAAPATAVVREVAAVVGGRADVVVDMTPGATTPLQASIELAAVGGTVLWGGLKRSSELPPVPVDEVIRRELTVRGLWARPSWAVAAALEWLASDPGLADLCAESVPLERLDTAFAQATHPDPAQRPLHVAVVRR